MRAALFAITLIATAAYVVMGSLPIVIPLLDDPWGSDLPLVTLLTASLVGGLAISFNSEHSPLHLGFAPSLAGPFALLIGSYAVFFLLSSNGLGFLIGLERYMAAWFEGQQIAPLALIGADTPNTILSALEAAWANRSEVESRLSDAWNWWQLAPFLPFALINAGTKEAVGLRVFGSTALVSAMVVTVGTPSHALLAAQAIGAPFAILLPGAWLAQIAEGRPVPSTFRHPGLIGRISHVVGLILAGLWAWFVSTPRLFPKPSPETAWIEHPSYIAALGALASLGLHALGGTRYSPFRLQLAHSGVFLLGLWGGTAWLWTGSWAVTSLVLPVLYLVNIYSPLKWRGWLLGTLTTAAMLGLAVVALQTLSPEQIEDGAFAVGAPFLIMLVAGLPVAAVEAIKGGGLWRSLFAFGSGGSGHFASLLFLLRHDFTCRMRVPHRLAAPMFCGFATADQDSQWGSRPLGLDSPYPILTIANTGGGKTLYAAANVTPTWPGGMAVLDPKAQHAHMVGHLREQRSGRPSFYVDIDGDHPDLYEGGIAARWNPVSEIDIASPDAVTKLRKIGDCLFPAHKHTSGSSEHFRQNAAVVFTGLAAHVLSTMEKKHHTLSAIAETLLMGHPENYVADPKAFEQLVDEMAINEAVSRAPMRAAQLLMQGGKNEVGGFITSLSKALEWTLDEPFRRSMATSDFQMRQISQDRISVFLTPRFDRMQDDGMRRYMRMFFTFALMGAATPRDHKHKPLVLLDEFPQLGKNFEPVKEGLVTLREAGVKTWVMVQNLAQLRERYDNYQDFLSSSDLQVFAVNDIETAKAVSDLLGEHQEYDPVSRRHDRQHPLRTPNEVMQDLRPGSKIAYVKPVDGAPMRIRLVPYFKFHGQLGRKPG